jgi:LacI family transcriptional regulator, repressor for deo operon, udp, cdd, tsx, nupC, and nupG
VRADGRVNGAPVTAGSRPGPGGVTIYDVAQACGVSASTVSRAFSRPGLVNAQTADRVRQAAERLGYRATPVARPIRLQRTSLISVIVSDLANPYFGDLLHGAHHAAATADYCLIVSDVRESPSAERLAIERVIPLVDGLILATSRISDSAIRVAAKQLPTVVLNRVVSDVPSMITDNAGGVGLALEHLHGLGHRSVTYVSGPEASWANGMRWRGLRDRARHLGVQARATRPMPPTIAGGRIAAGRLTTRPTSAVITYNDLMAIGLMQGMAHAGIRVPEEISVVGFDNTLGSALVTPGLTTVAAPLRHLGSRAVQSILTQLQQGRHRPVDAAPVQVPAKLRVRGSTGPAPDLPASY